MAKTIGLVFPEKPKSAKSPGGQEKPKTER